MAKGTIGIGVIGCGTIAEFMLNAWVPVMKGARLAGVSDPTAERTSLFADKYGIPSTWSDHHDLLNAPEIDAVLVLTPNHLHASQTIDALAAGKHVLCQKPMALTVADADRMQAAATEHGGLLMAAFARRFWAYFQALEALKSQGVLGDIRAVRSQFSHSGIGRYYKPASDWFSDRQKAGGGPLFDLGVHHFDAMRWLVGAEVIEVGAMTAGPAAANSLEDNAAVNLRFSNGVIGQGFYSFTTQSPPNVSLERMELYGSKATAIVALDHPGRATLRLSIDGDPLTRGGWVDLPVPDPVPAFAGVMQNFVDSIAQGSRPVTDGLDGVRSVAIAEAAYEAQRSGRVVACR